jgi:uncharacterized protein YeaO (DUF488 family)
MVLEYCLHGLDHVKKENENWDAWYRELAPSRQLWYDYFKSNKIDWNQYRQQFIEENCFCENEKNCHRSIVKELALNYYLRKQIN